MNYFYCRFLTSSLFFTQLYFHVTTIQKALSKHQQSDYDTRYSGTPFMQEFLSPNFATPVSSHPDQPV